MEEVLESKDMEKIVKDIMVLGIGKKIKVKLVYTYQVLIK